jgi:Helix-turn-helix domain
MDRKAVELFGINALNTVEDTKRILRRSTSAVYEDIAAGKLKAVKIGGSTRITGESIIVCIEQAPLAVITTGLFARCDDLTAEQQDKMANITPHGATMQKRRRGRPIGTKNKNKVIRPAA